MSLIETAKHAFHSGMFKRLPNVSAAVMTLQFGFDLGLSPTTSLTSIHFFEGKPSMSGNLMWTLVKSHPEYRKSRVKTLTPQLCEIEWIENGELQGISSFSIEEAKAAGLTNKDNWRKWPKSMLFNRAVSLGFKLYTPHLSRGYAVYTPEEFNQATDEDGNPVQDAVFSIAPSAPSKPQISAAEKLEKVLQGSGVTRELVAETLGLALSELDSLTESELFTVEKFVQDRKALVA